MLLDSNVWIQILATPSDVSFVVFRHLTLQLRKQNRINKGVLFFLLVFSRGRFWSFFFVPGSMLLCFSAYIASLLFLRFLLFLLLCFSASPCFSAFVLLCLSTCTILLFLFFSHVFLLLYFLLLCFFASCFFVSLFFIFFCFILFCLYPT